MILPIKKKEKIHMMSREFLRAFAKFTIWTLAGMGLALVAVIALIVTLVIVL